MSYTGPFTLPSAACRYTNFVYILDGTQSRQAIPMQRPGPARANTANVLHLPLGGVNVKGVSPPLYVVCTLFHYTNSLCNIQLAQRACNADRRLIRALFCLFSCRLFSFFSIECGRWLRRPAMRPCGVGWVVVAGRPRRCWCGRNGRPLMSCFCNDGGRRMGYRGFIQGNDSLLDSCWVHGFTC